MNHLFELPEQICYVQCGICTTILLVSVPCSSLSMPVTVACGHCSSLLSVNMMKATLVPLHFLPFSFSQCGKRFRDVLHFSVLFMLKSLHVSPLSFQPKEACGEMNSGKFFDSFKRSNLKFSEYAVEEDLIPVTPPVVNKPPQKRQRAPSAYNCFIKDEIRRLKAQNPQMTHKEAFRTAAKNWANFPPIQEKEVTESCIQIEETGIWNTKTAEVHKDGKCFPRNSQF